MFGYANKEFEFECDLKYSDMVDFGTSVAIVLVALLKADNLVLWCRQ